jgi:hypothetical protein
MFRVHRREEYLRDWINLKPSLWILKILKPGTGFADEIFRMEKQSGYKILPVNQNGNVDFMIKRATKSDKFVKFIRFVKFET